MKITKIFLAAALIAGSALTANAVQVDNTIDPGHPRINEVDTRINNQEQRVQHQEADGKITERQAARDDAKLQREQNSLNKDAALNGGHITKGEQKNLNHRLNKGNRMDHRQKQKDAQ